MMLIYQKNLKYYGNTFFHCISVVNGQGSSGLRYVGSPFFGQCYTGNMVCAGGNAISESDKALTYLYGIGTDHGVWWTPTDGSWSRHSGGGWVSHIIIQDDTIYGIGSDKAIYSLSVHGSSWSRITTGAVIELASFKGITIIIIFE